MLTSYADVIYSMLNHFESPLMSLDAELNQVDDRGQTKSFETSTERKTERQEGKVQSFNSHHFITGTYLAMVVLDVLLCICQLIVTKTGCDQFCAYLFLNHSHAGHSRMSINVLGWLCGNISMITSV